MDKSPLKIRRMFAAITPVYDLMNRLMSAGADARWRRAAARHCAGARRVLDVATGTGDMAAAVGRGVIGLDCTRPMMERARRKYALPLVEGDAMRLPFRNGMFDACTVAFGVRNFADLGRGLREMARVLAPGGRLVILELVMPGGRWTSTYLARVIPALARIVAGGNEAYQYLGESVADFARADELARIVAAAGLGGVAVHRLTLGFACIVTATRSAS